MDGQFSDEKGGLHFRKWCHKILENFHLGDTTKYDYREDPVHSYCCWQQYITFTQRLLRLQRKELFSMILYCNSWNISLDMDVSIYLLGASKARSVCSVAARHKYWGDFCREAAVNWYVCCKEHALSAY